MKKLNNAVNRIDQLLAYISVATLFIMMVWIFLDVTLRFFYKPINGTTEITGEYLMPILIYFSFSYTQKHKGHINVDIFYNKFNSLFKDVFSILANILAFLIFSLLGVNNFQKFIEYFEDGTRSSSLLAYPLWPALVIISLGIFVFSFRILIEVIEIVKNNLKLEKKA